ncbi:putative transcription factor MYB-HB-like family [Helianthus debilis subsp. tardiflorus]
MSSEPPPNTSTTPPYPATISYKNHHLSTSTLHGGAATIRDYRKGNWTPEETLILITAKRLDDERRITTTSSSRTGGELRWKWVENYCWSNGCLRSQNQCNDKWDNLLRDYKKVRDYQNRSTGQPSYWAMDKTQRKHLNLPSNMLPNIYEALNDVVQKKHFPNKTSFPLQQPLSALPPPPAPLPPPPPPPPPASASAESLESQGDEAERVDSETKRRRVRDEDIGSAIIRSTKLLSETLKHHDDNKEKRHNQLVELEQQRLQLEETRNEVNRQGIAALITSINKLSEAIHSLISEKRT